MRWYEYKMETDDLYAPDDLKAKLLAMTDQLTEEEKAQPMMKIDVPVPAQSAPVQPKKKLIRFPAKRVGALAACLAVCVVGYGAFATGQIGLGAKSSSPAVYYSADSTAAVMAAAPAPENRKKKKLHSMPSLVIIVWPLLQRSMIRSCRLWLRST